jgi:hypothetical protein
MGSRPAVVAVPVNGAEIIYDTEAVSNFGDVTFPVGGLVLDITLPTEGPSRREAGRVASFMLFFSCDLGLNKLFFTQPSFVEAGNDYSASCVDLGVSGATSIVEGLCHYSVAVTDGSSVDLNPDVDALQIHIALGVDTSANAVPTCPLEQPVATTVAAETEDPSGSESGEEDETTQAAVITTSTAAPASSTAKSSTAQSSTAPVTTAKPTTAVAPSTATTASASTEAADETTSVDESSDGIADETTADATTFEPTSEGDAVDATTETAADLTATVVDGETTGEPTSEPVADVTNTEPPVEDN